MTLRDLPNCPLIKTTVRPLQKKTSTSQETSCPLHRKCNFIENIVQACKSLHRKWYSTHFHKDKNFKKIKNSVLGLVNNWYVRLNSSLMKLCVTLYV